VFENFIRNKRLQEALEENERIQQQDRAIEMRHMIGNVAHDLKTVSFCFYYVMLMLY
jgi:signal transduction histidine kinase